MNGHTSGIHRRGRPPRALPIDGLAELAVRVGGVRRKDLAPGDRVIVSTKNSIYSLTAQDDGSYLVSGGWYEREGRGPTRIRVAGCTAGGRALFTEHIAAPGLFMEFEDGLRTTRIRRVRRIAANPGST
jgi:hypothetical protein